MSSFFQMTPYVRSICFMGGLLGVFRKRAPPGGSSSLDGILGCGIPSLMLFYQIVRGFAIEILPRITLPQVFPARNFIKS